MTGKFKNLKAIQNRNKKRIRDYQKGKAKVAILNSTDAVRNTVVDGIARGVKTGRDRGDGSIASAAGEYPATDTGFLVSNVSTKVTTEGETVIGQIISAAPYSKHLEFGTRNMAARPFMQPSLDRNAKKIKEIFVREGIIDR